MELKYNNQIFTQKNATMVSIYDLFKILPLSNFIVMYTTIDIYIIKKVAELREKAGLKQEELSHLLGFATGSTFVSSAERFYKAKYNIYHLNELAKILECDIADFFPHPFQDANSLQEYRDAKKEAKSKTKEK